jgi:DNA polymerase III subunit delta'
MTELLASVVGHAIPVGVVRRALETSRRHHAYLFDGPLHVGRERVARAFAQAMLCVQPQKSTMLACGECSACERVPAESTRMPAHPDLIILGRGLYEPGQIGRKTAETQDLSIDQVRTLVLSRAAYGPHEGRARVIIIRAAEDLSTSAANALLKTLEEPLPKTHFILLTSRPDTLLATIRSRTLRVRFGLLAADAVSEIATASGKEIPPGILAEAVLAGTTEKLFESDAARESRERAFTSTVMAAIDAPTFSNALDVAAEAKKEKDALPELLAAVARDIASRASASSSVPLAKRHGYVLRALEALDGNASPQLTLEQMFSAMRRL